MQHVKCHLLLYHPGGLTGGAIAGIVIATVVFVILNLIMITVIAYYIRSKSKKSASKVSANNPTGVRDLQAEYHQVERPQSCAQPLDTIRPRDSTHPDNQSNTVSQESDRRRFLNRGVRRIFARDWFSKTVADKTITILWQVVIFLNFRNRIYTLQHIYLFSFSSSTLMSIYILKLMKRLKQTCPMRYV